MTTTDTDWSPTFIFRNKHDAEGRMLSAPGPAMRRKVAGAWQYRRMTPDEETAYLRSRAGW
jgi:hypothetical protein